ncbi:MAG: hypothetical protein Q4D14_03820 [Bacteroidales bacterium]|nr:hypothetical protein [Bacteroidales bacterium]
MKKRILILTITLTALLLACGGDTFKYYFLKGFYCSYLVVEDMKVQKVADDWMYLSSVGDELNVLCDFLGGLNKNSFDAFAVSHGDTAYNREEAFVVFGEKPNYVPLISLEYKTMGMDIQSITITSDKDYDETHLAGTPLNDIIRCVTYSAMEYIRQGYPDSIPYVFRKEEGEEINGVPVGIENYLLDSQSTGRWTRTDKMLSEYSQEDLKLINRCKYYLRNDPFVKEKLHPVALFQFTSLPTLEQDYVMTVTITGTDMMDELTFVTSCEFSFGTDSIN